MDLTALALRLIACPRCTAGPRARCMTTSGRTSSRLHSARTRPVYDAWRIGYSQGLTDSLDAAERVVAGHEARHGTGTTATADDVVTVLRWRL